MTSPSEEELIAQLPPLLREIAEITGLNAAMLLAAEYGCMRKLIPPPRRLNPDHWLVRLVGTGAALAIAKRYAGDTLEIPSLLHSDARRRRRKIRELADAGERRVDIARKIGVHRRTVQRVLKRAGGAASGQPELPLFDSGRPASEE